MPRKRAERFLKVCELQECGKEFKTVNLRKRFCCQRHQLKAWNKTHVMTAVGEIAKPRS